MRILKMAAVFVAAVTIAAGCGGQTTSTDKQEAGSTDATGSVSSDDSSTPANTSDEDQTDSAATGSDGGRVVIVVGDRTYEMFPVEPSPLCFFNADGSMVVQAASADYDISDLYAPIGTTAYLLIQSNDWQPPAEDATGFFNFPSITVSDLDSGENFVADVNNYAGFVAPEDSAVLESNLGDAGARGAARFVESSQATSQEAIISYDGTFDVDCES